MAGSDSMNLVGTTQKKLAFLDRINNAAILKTTVARQKIVQLIVISRVTMDARMPTYQVAFFEVVYKDYVLNNQRIILPKLSLKQHDNLFFAGLQQQFINKLSSIE